jgi:hypothetical protein
MSKTVRVLVPIASSHAVRVERRPRPPRVTSVAFLHNGQPIFDPIAPALIAALRDASVRVTTWRKLRYSSPAELSVLDEIAGTARAAVVGLAC